MKEKIQSSLYRGFFYYYCSLKVERRSVRMKCHAPISRIGNLAQEAVVATNEDVLLAARGRQRSDAIDHRLTQIQSGQGFKSCRVVAGDATIVASRIEAKPV